MQQPRGIKRFFASRPGLLVLGLIAVGAMIGSFLYLGPFVAIPTLLLFGLAVPIYAGWKRPRTLALIGIVVLLVAAPLTSLADAQAIRVPSPAYSSDATPPSGNGGSVLDQAIVNPYTGASGGTYVFSVILNPQYVPANDSAPLWVELFVSTCPGATGNASPNCASGYPFVVSNKTLPANQTTPETLSFDVALSGPNIWWWQMAAVVESPRTSTNLTWIFLDVPNGYGAVQGPVTGDFLSTFAILVVPITEVMFLYSATVFFIALLVYMFLKAREARRKAAAAPMVGPDGSTPPATAGGGTTEPAAPPTTAPNERSCPNCGAVVYPSESSCWKCGKPLSKGPSEPSPPLKSG